MSGPQRRTFTALWWLISSVLAFSSEAVLVAVAGVPLQPLSWLYASGATIVATGVAIASCLVFATALRVSGTTERLTRLRDPAELLRTIIAFGVGVAVNALFALPALFAIDGAIATSRLRVIASWLVMLVAGALALVFALAALRRMPRAPARVAKGVLIGAALVVVGCGATGLYLARDPLSEIDLRGARAVVHLAFWVAVGTWLARRLGPRLARIPSVVLVLLLVVAAHPCLGIGPLGSLAMQGRGLVLNRALQSRLIAPLLVAPNADIGKSDLSRLLAQTAPPQGYAPARNLVIICVDTLRIDRVGLYGNARRPTTPAIDAFFGDHVRVERVYTTAPMTFAAVSSMFTGKYHRGLHWDARRGLKLLGDEQTLAEQLKQAGFRTDLFLYSDYVINDAAPDEGFLQGFDRVHRKAPRDVDRDEAMTLEVLPALASIEDGARHFMWLHYVSPHHPYQTHPDAPIFGPEPSDSYDNEVAHTDVLLARVFERLKELGALENTIVMLIADHGENLDDGHEVNRHGRDVYEETTRVPWLVRLPGPGVRRVVPGSVNLLDVAPTMLDLLGVPRIPGMQGLSLADAILNGSAIPERSLILEVANVATLEATSYAVQRGNWKALFTAEPAPVAVFDLAADPGERRPIPYSTDMHAAYFADLRAYLDLVSVGKRLR